jgi:hypothetical protein
MENSKETKLVKGSSFHKDNYILHLNALFLEREVLEEFHIFMKGRKHLEEWLFLCKIRELEKIKDPKLKMRSLKIIIEMFLLEDSPNHLEIQKKFKNPILEFYETLLLENYNFISNGNDWLIQICQILNSIENFVTQEFINHCWKPFLNTNSCEGLTKKFHKKSSVCSPRITQFFNYKDEYFKHPFIFDQDFQFADLLTKDNFHWKNLSTETFSLFCTNLNYLPNVEGSKNAFTTKYEFLLPVPFQRLAFAYNSRENKLNTEPDSKHLETLNYYDYESLQKIFQENGWENEIGAFERTMCQNILHLSLPFPMNLRIYNHSSSARYDKRNENIMIVSKPYQVNGLEFSKSALMEVSLDSNKPMKKLKAIPLFSFCFTNYQKIDENQVLFSQVLVMDVGGWASDENVMKLLVQRRASKLRDSLIQMCQNFPVYSNLGEIQEILCKEENGKVIDGMGKLMFDLKIESGDQ